MLIASHFCVTVDSLHFQWTARRLSVVGKLWPLWPRQLPRGQAQPVLVCHQRQGLSLPQLCHSQWASRRDQASLRRGSLLSAPHFPVRLESMTAFSLSLSQIYIFSSLNQLGVLHLHDSISSIRKGRPCRYPAHMTRCHLHTWLPVHNGNIVTHMFNSGQTLLHHLPSLQLLLELPPSSLPLHLMLQCGERRTNIVTFMHS